MKEKERAQKSFHPRTVFPSPPQSLGALFAHTNKDVRDQARALVLGLYTYIGDAVRPALKSLKDVQLKELEAEWESITPNAKPPRKVRSAAAKAAKKVRASNGGACWKLSHRRRRRRRALALTRTLPLLRAPFLFQADASAAAAADVEGDDAAEGSDNEDEASPAIDAYELADPVAILGKIPSSFAEDVEAAKWSIRCEAVEAVNKMANTPKLADGDYGDLVRTMKRVRGRRVGP